MTMELDDRCGVCELFKDDAQYLGEYLLLSFLSDILAI